MPQFKDANDREWNIRLDGLLIKDLKEAHKIDLADVSGETYARLHRDPSLLTVAVCFLCDAQAKAQALTPTQVASGMTGEAIDRAWDAVWGAAKVFFPPRLLSALQSRFEVQNQMMDQWATLQPLLAVLSKPEVPEAMRNVAMGELAKMMRTMSGTNSEASTTSESATGPADVQLKPATDSPATAELTPAA
jgi:hypothetical protein